MPGTSPSHPVAHRLRIIAQLITFGSEQRRDLLSTLTTSTTKVRNPRSWSDENVAAEDKPPTENISSRESLDRSQTTVMYKGLLLAFLCGVLYTLRSVIVKYLKNINPAAASMYGSIGMFTLSLPQSVKSQGNLLGPREFRCALFLRGILGVAYVYLSHFAVRYLPLGEAATIIYSVQIFVNIAAKIFLKESCGITQSVTVLITFVGIIFIVKVPTFLSKSTFIYSTEYIYGMVAAFSSLIPFTGMFIVSRKLAGVHHSIVMLNTGCIGLFGSAILTVITGHFSLPTCGVQRWLIILIGILSYLAVTIFTIALQLENAGPVSTVIASSDVALSFLWQLFFFHDRPDSFSIVGAVLLGLAIVLTGLSKWTSSLPSHSPAAKYFKFLSM